MVLPFLSVTCRFSFWRHTNEKLPRCGGVTIICSVLMEIAAEQL